MKHFVEARTDSLDALRKFGEIAEKACLIVDLQGRCRVLIKPRQGVPAESVRGKVEEFLPSAADGFWAGEFWLEEESAPLADRALFQRIWDEARPEPPGQQDVFVLDRRMSKDGWFARALETPWPLNEHTPPVISFYSFKGGVGRTTALAALAVNLARAGQRVVVIDFDLEAPGTGPLLSASGTILSACGMVDYLLERPVLGPGAIDLADFYFRNDELAVIRDGEPIIVVSAGVLDQWYLEKLARLNYEYLYRSSSVSQASDSPLYDLLRVLRDKFEPVAILVDSRAGFHDIGGLSLSGLAHLQVLFGLNSKQSWAGLSLAVAHLGRDMTLSGRAQRDCMLIHAMAPPSGPVREHEIRSFKEQSYQTFCDHYYDPPDSGQGEWPVPDPESVESPHYPHILSWNPGLQASQSLADIASLLCEGEYRSLAAAILERLGRSL